MSSQRFVFYDYETTGRDSALDRPIQFAASVADMDLNSVEDIEFKAKLAGDVIPSPIATLIHGLSPKSLESGLSETEFAQRVGSIFEQPNTMVLGYNTSGFDDAFTQHLFWRNFRPAFTWQYADGNRRYDLLPMVRATYLFANDALSWPQRDGHLSVKLENLAPENGFEGHNAHDALGDTRATLHLARLIKQNAQAVWDACIAQANKHHVNQLIEHAIATHGALIQVDSTFGGDRGFAGIVYPLGQVHGDQNEWYCVDLGVDPQVLDQYSPAQLRDALFTPKAKRTEDTPKVGLRRIRVNKAPCLLPLEWLKGNDHALATMQIDRQAFAQRRKWLEQRDRTHWLTIAEAVFSYESSQHPLVDAQLYGQFVGDHDAQRSRAVLQTQPDDLLADPPQFDDARLNEMLPLYLARNFPEKLGPRQYKQWQRYKKQRWKFDQGNKHMNVDRFMAEMQEAAAKATSPEQTEALMDLEQWVVRHAP